MNHLEEIIHKSMGSRWADVPMQSLSETDSTNTRLKEWAREGRIAAPYVLTADSQTAGRGRLGRRFVSPPGTGLYMSILVVPPENTDAGKITVLAAVAVCRRGGASAAFDRLNKYFTISNMPVAPSQYWNSLHGAAPGEAAADAEGLQIMRTLADNLAWMIDALPAPPARQPKTFTNFIR